MRQVKIGNLSFSKVICGSNPFYGHSHFSEARDTEYSTRFNDQAVEQVIRHCFDLGIKTVQETPKPFILVKTLGAGRIPPNEAIQFVAENSKPNDLISMGFGTVEEAEESIQLVEKYF